MVCRSVVPRGRSGTGSGALAASAGLSRYSRAIGSCRLHTVLLAGSSHIVPAAGRQIVDTRRAVGADGVLRPVRRLTRPRDETAVHGVGSAALLGLGVPAVG